MLFFDDYHIYFVNKNNTRMLNKKIIDQSSKPFIIIGIYANGMLLIGKEHKIYNERYWENITQR